MKDWYISTYLEELRATSDPIVRQVLRATDEKKAKH
jgi:hypothetical protein